jgi:hypothetical protein
MKIELKPFQETATRDVLTKLGKARQSVSDNECEAIILSAPTGSGKTITVAAVIDQTFGGGMASQRGQTLYSCGSPLARTESAEPKQTSQPALSPITHG